MTMDNNKLGIALHLGLSHDNGATLPRSVVGDAMATQLHRLYDAREAADEKFSEATVDLQVLMGMNSGIETSEGRITWKMGSTGDIDWRGVAMELGAETNPEVIAKHRKTPIRRMSWPKAWRK